jgi:hypothetical protein
VDLGFWARGKTPGPRPPPPPPSMTSCRCQACVGGPPVPSVTPTQGPACTSAASGVAFVEVEGEVGETGGCADQSCRSLKAIDGRVTTERMPAWGAGPMRPQPQTGQEQGLGQGLVREVGQGLLRGRGRGPHAPWSTAGSCACPQPPGPGSGSPVGQARPHGPRPHYHPHRAPGGPWLHRGPLPLLERLVLGQPWVHAQLQVLVVVQPGRPGPWGPHAWPGVPRRRQLATPSGPGPPRGHGPPQASQQQRARLRGWARGRPAALPGSRGAGLV